jgi:hypothetical protein
MVGARAETSQREEGLRQRAREMARRAVADPFPARGWPRCPFAKGGSLAVFTFLSVRVGSVLRANFVSRGLIREELIF